MSVNQSKKLKTSRQRNLVLSVLRSTHCHPTADWIFERARQQMSNISLGTIYRNLGLLRDEGKIQELNIGKGIRCYDGDLRDHYHVRCTVCGKVEDVPHVSPRVSIDEIEKLTGYRIHNHCLEFQGICSECDHSR